MRRTFFLVSLIAAAASVHAGTGTVGRSAAAKAASIVRVRPALIEDLKAHPEDAERFYAAYPGGREKIGDIAETMLAVIDKTLPDYVEFALTEGAPETAEMTVEEAYESLKRSHETLSFVFTPKSRAVIAEAYEKIKSRRLARQMAATVESLVGPEKVHYETGLFAVDGPIQSTRRSLKDSVADAGLQPQMEKAAKPKEAFMPGPVTTHEAQVAYGPGSGMLHAGGVMLTAALFPAMVGFSEHLQPEPAPGAFALMRVVAAALLGLAATIFVPAFLRPRDPNAKPFDGIVTLAAIAGGFFLGVGIVNFLATGSLGGGHMILAAMMGVTAGASLLIDRLSAKGQPSSAAARANALLTVVGWTAGVMGMIGLRHVGHGLGVVYGLLLMVAVIAASNLGGAATVARALERASGRAKKTLLVMAGLAIAAGIAYGSPPMALGLALSLVFSALVNRAGVFRSAANQRKEPKQ